MATSIRTLVSNEIRELEKDIARQRSELAGLKEELATLKKVYRLLGGASPRRGKSPGRARNAPAGNVDWNLVLRRLPRNVHYGRRSPEERREGKIQRVPAAGHIAVDQGRKNGAGRTR